MAVFGLPYREIWAIDFEFAAGPGCVPDVVCMVAKEIGSGRLIRLWRDDFKPDPPFDIGADVLFAAYYASAEMGCFQQLGWSMPANVLDLYTEFRCETNGLTLPHGRGLLGALARHTLSSISKGEKQDLRDLVLAGGPWTDQQRDDILTYCQGDADCLGPLLERMLPRITAHPDGLNNALLRGAFMKTVAVMEHNGVPIDTETLGRLRENWTAIKAELINKVDLDYHVYDDGVFRGGRFAAYLDRKGIRNWPKSPETGKLLLDKDTFKSMAGSYRCLRELRELRVTLSELRLRKTAGRPRRAQPRVMLSPVSGPLLVAARRPATGFIFGPSTWLRRLRSKPRNHGPGVGIHRLARARRCGDRRPSCRMIRRCWRRPSPDFFVPVGSRRWPGWRHQVATKQSHPDIRDPVQNLSVGSELRDGCRPRWPPGPGFSIAGGAEPDRPAGAHLSGLHRVGAAGDRRRHHAGITVDVFRLDPVHGVGPVHRDPQLADPERRRGDAAAGVQSDRRAGRHVVLPCSRCGAGRGRCGFDR